ncbi:MAG: glycoside hydrolase family 2 protein [Bacteroidota bacterium]
MQLVQAKAVKTGMLHWRARKWRTSGALFWQLNDCWPASSWSAIDYAKRPKALYYWSKHFNKPTKVVFKKRNDCVIPIIVNDSLTPFRGKIIIVKQKVDGGKLFEISANISIEKNSILRVNKLPVEITADETTFLYARLIDIASDAAVDEEDFIAVPWLDFKRPDIKYVITEPSPTEKLVTFVSNVFIQGVYLDLGEKVGEVSDNFFTLYPNVEKQVLVKSYLIKDNLQIRTPLVQE